jgi:hypothetical protein
LVALAETLRDIPRQTAETLIVTHWSKIKGRPLFTQAALYVSTDKTRELAASAIKENPNGASFAFVGSFFGIRTSGLAERLTPEHLESLNPYLNHLDSMTISEMISHCGERGELAWARQNLLPEFERRRTEADPHDDSKDLSIIERAVVEWMPSIQQEYARLEKIASDSKHAQFQLELFSKDVLKRGESLEQFCLTVRNWLQSQPTIDSPNVFAFVIRQWGRRSDLPALKAAYDGLEGRPNNT